MGISAFIMKPIFHDEVASAIREALDDKAKELIAADATIC